MILFLAAQAAIGAVVSVVTAFYYLRVIKIMYFDSPAEALDQSAGTAVNAVVLVTALLTSLFIFTPFAGPVVGWAQAAAQSLVP